MSQILALQVRSNVFEAPEKIANFVTDTCNSVINQCNATANKTKDFILRNKHNIFFIACTATTAFFAPGLFIPTFVATLIIRVEVSRQLKNLADYYMKENLNPYKQTPNYGPEYANSLALTMGTIATMDAIALGTIFTTSSVTIALLPVLGGIAAGNAAAKCAMDIANSWI